MHCSLSGGRCGSVTSKMEAVVRSEADDTMMWHTNTQTPFNIKQSLHFIQAFLSMLKTINTTTFISPRYGHRTAAKRVMDPTLHHFVLLCYCMCRVKLHSSFYKSKYI
jgi:hypothetical protein